MSTPLQLPPDIIRLICNQILSQALPSQPTLLVDPYLHFSNSSELGPKYLDPDPIVQAQLSLKALCLVSKSWNDEARKALWSLGIRFGLPNTFEKVVYLVDPIGTLFDAPGAVEPFWASSPPATRHFTPHHHNRADDLIKVKSQSSYVPNTLLSSCLKNPPFPPIPEHKKKYKGSSRRSISLKRESGCYVLEARVLDQDQSMSPIQTHSSFFREKQVDERHARRLRNNNHDLDHVERSISPIRGRIEFQSLSKAFRIATSQASPQVSISSPILVDSGADSDEQEFVFDTQLDDIFNPGPYITCISFSKYRSHGMRRSIAEGQVRFVTAERLIRLLKSTRSRYMSTPGYDSDSNSDEESNSEMFRKGHLQSIGFSEYMDSAISKPVLDEIFLRGGVEVEYEINDEININATEESPRGRNPARKQLRPILRHATPHHTLPAPVQDPSQGYFQMPVPTITSTLVSSIEHQTSSRIERRMESSLMMETPIKAIDFCGCISSNFKSAITDFILDHSLSNPYDSSTPTRQSMVSNLLNTPRLRSTTFPWLTRLGLSHMMMLTDTELADFLSGFPNLIDLDLSHTRTGPVVLHTLQLLKKSRRCGGEDNKDQVSSFRSLNLAKCRGLTEGSLIGFLCGGYPDRMLIEDKWEDPMESIGGLEELSLYGDQTLPTPIAAEDLDRFFSTCPCLLSGKLTTLDLSSIKIDDETFDLRSKMPAQPNLIQFGLAACPNVSLQTVRGLLEEKMKMVEVLDLSASCRSAMIRLTRPNRLGSPFLSVLSPGLLHKELIEPLCATESNGRRVGNLRVIELDEITLECFAGGAQGWRVAFGRGQRAWYVDLSVSVKVYAKDPKTDHLRMEGCTLPYTRVLEHHEMSLDVDQVKHQESPTALNLRDSLNRLKNSDDVIRSSEIGWMSRKIEILNGSGFLGRQGGLYGFHAFANNHI